MTKKLIFIISLYCLVIPLWALGQRGWEKLNPQVVKDINDVFFINSSEGWIVGSSGTILHTVDGGVHWEIQQTNPSYFLQSVWFQNDSSGWIAGNAGILLSTSDKGKNWSASGSPLSTNYIDIMFCDATNGWIVGEEGIILHSVDGGKHWQYQHAGVQEPILSVSFTDPNNGWLAGTFSPGWLSHTSNSGTDWVNMMQPMEKLTYDVFFVSPYRGWVGTDGMLLFSDDVGETWTEQPLPGDAGNVVDIFFVNDTLGWCITEKQVFATEDAGKTWLMQLQLGGNDYLTAVHFTDPQHGWVVGRKGLVYATTDGGGMGLAEVDISDQILLYPNPSCGNFTLRLRESFPGGKPFTIEVFDLSGQLLYRDNSPLEDEFSFNLGGFSGTAFLKISRGRETASRMMILP